MIVSILYAILAILGLSFLIFIHELGHYYMARHLGMRVETFSIGFGKPLYTWYRDGVRWQIGWLLFGGYVKIAGMDTGEQGNPYEVKDGFFEKKPIDRIKVAFMGPLVNIVFAVLAFALLFAIGGREKNFSEYTHKIGWVDPKSDLYAKGIRPGDEISSYNKQAYQSTKDHLYGPMTASGEIDVKGNRVNSQTQEKIPFDYKVKTYPHPSSLDKDIVTAGIIQPASYIIYDQLPNGKENPLPEGSPLENSGIQYGDRVVWANGETIYSNQQLSHLLNDSRALLTIQRGQETFLRRAPRVKAEELRIDNEFREELIDWQFEAQLNGSKIQNLYTLPYNLNNEGVVENPMKFIDQEKENEAFPSSVFSELETPLQAGDKILAVDGIPVTYSYQILALLQEPHANLIVERGMQTKELPSWQKGDVLFEQQFKQEDLQKLTSAVGFNPQERASGNLYLLRTVTPKKRNQFKLSPESQAALEKEIENQKKEIEGIEDPEKRAYAMHLLETRDNQLVLGLPAVRDQKVQYNPGPFALFGSVFDEIWNTLGALFTGSLNPKWMSGPIGIVQVVHDNSMTSLKEALFWLGAISLNLGVLNLLPLPVLDGGNICFALYEMITGQQMKSKTMEKLVIPFAFLLMGFFIFLTYNDLSRLIGSFFR